MTEKWLSAQGRGTTDEIRNKENTIALIKSYDNTPVYLCSNFVGSGDVDRLKRWDKKSKEYLEVDRPEAVKL